VTGLLPVDKPVGPTSHDVVARARRALGERRVGHAGTLDPFASGLLLVCVGTTTRLVEYLHDLDKVYEAEALLGTITDTDDLEGQVLAESDRWREVTPDAVLAALRSQLGTRLQQPPVFSARKVGGEAAYLKARRGEAVELAATPVTIHEVELLEVDLPRVRFRVRCGTGTYIRAMARDLGEALGCGAHLTALRRTAIGPFRVEEALPAAALEPAAKEPAAQEPGAQEPGARGEVLRRLLPARDAVRHLPALEVDEDGERRLRMGQRVELPAGLAAPVDGRGPIPEGEPLALVRGDLLVGIGVLDGGRIRPRKILPA
jgi:tRNA pseudouridine55 synthase